ncbi:MAG: hypothetical protein QXH67_07090 [Candidatus Bathyarchaeia archaeon]
MRSYNQRGRRLLQRYLGGGPDRMRGVIYMRSDASEPHFSRMKLLLKFLKVCGRGGYAYLN